MNPLIELRRKIAKRTGAQTGTVIEVAGTVLRVRTASGVVVVRGEASVGDDVLVHEGVVQGRVNAEASVPIYRI
jgi:serine acetyltransferase